MKRLLPILCACVALLFVGCGSQSVGAGGTATPFTCTPFPNGHGPFHYVAIGASDAVGFGAACPERQGYVPLLGQRMPSGAQVTNLGIGGATVKVALVDELPYAIAAKPNLVTVWLAANDFKAMQSGSLTLATYAQQLDQLLGALQAQTSAHVYVGNLPQLAQLPYFKHGTTPLDQVTAANKSWNDAIAATVANHGDVLVDLYSSDLASHPEYIFADGFHPSTLGYVQLADAFWVTIQAHGGPTA